MSIEGPNFSEGPQNETDIPNESEKPTGWSTITNEYEKKDFRDHVEEANRLKQKAQALTSAQAAPKTGIVDLTKAETESIINGKRVKGVQEYTGKHTTKLNRYPVQEGFVEGMMHESYEKGQPLRVLNIGVSDGREALSYIQMASGVAGENAIDKALDLELVEYDKIPLIKKANLGEAVSDSAYNYLENLYNTPKAHFLTPFQPFVKELKDKNEKRDVVLFNNVIQWIDYKVPEEKMIEDMQNLIDVVEDDGLFCMSCVESMLKKDPQVKSLFDKTINMLQSQGFTMKKDIISDNGFDDHSVVFKKNNTVH